MVLTSMLVTLWSLLSRLKRCQTHHYSWEYLCFKTWCVKPNDTALLKEMTMLSHTSLSSSKRILSKMLKYSCKQGILDHIWFIYRGTLSRIYRRKRLIITSRRPSQHPGEGSIFENILFMLTVNSFEVAFLSVSLHWNDSSQGRISAET